ncbi:hypothetical protein [Streptacidiphilus albus]|uniref:hypothetical protein n=1 Tax=Streptacidiphilus albus TaxID=105425 RepID=UPI00054B732F|nr:hypothetical protein [Streptacidiphilus albus]
MVDEQAVAKWHLNEEQWAQQVAASWLGDPAVRAVVEAAAPAAAQIVAPLVRHMVDQVEITRFCWRVCDIGALYPDGSESLNPFDPAAPGAWQLSDDERTLAGYVAAAFHQLVKLVVEKLEEAGVHVDAPWGSDQAVVAVLLLLEAEGSYQLPWGDARLLAEHLQPPGVSAITPDGRSTSARDGRSDEMARNVDRIRKAVRERAGGRDHRRPYAAARGQRSEPRATVLRREVLKEILDDDPTMKVEWLRRTWDLSKEKPGGRLRCELTARLAAEGLPAPNKPSRATLFKDFQVLGTSRN